MTRNHKAKDARRRAFKLKQRIQIATGVKVIPDRRAKLRKKAERHDTE